MVFGGTCRTQGSYDYSTDEVFAQVKPADATFPYLTDPSAPHMLYPYMLCSRRVAAL